MIYEVLYAYPWDVTISIRTSRYRGDILLEAASLLDGDDDDDDGDNDDDDDDPGTIVCKYWWQVYSFWPLSELMFVNRQIYREVVPILYGNEFQFVDLTRKADFMRMIYPETRRLFEKYAVFTFNMPSSRWKSERGKRL